MSMGNNGGTGRPLHSVQVTVETRVERATIPEVL